MKKEGREGESDREGGKEGQMERDYAWGKIGKINILIIMISKTY